MNTRRKISAFTMMDVLTGMVVMSIVVAMVFYLVTAINRQVHDYGTLRAQLNRYLVAKADLERRVEEASAIEKMPDGFRLYRDNDMIRYVWNKPYLLRYSGGTGDTVSDNVLRLETLALPGASPETLLLSVSLYLKFGEQELSCYLRKDYGISEPLNQQLIREF